MPAKSEHRIMKHGTSGVVVIPKPYRDYHQLKPGTPVIVLYDTLLLIAPKNMEHILKEKKPLIDQLLGQTLQERRGPVEPGPRPTAPTSPAKPEGASQHE